MKTQKTEKGISLTNQYRIFETGQFINDLEKDFSGQKKRICKKLLDYVYPQLKAQPFYGKNINKLVNYHPETWRYRIGDYRFFYSIDEKNRIVFMLTADNRSEAY
ncbi:MAG: type II toxin-antitoxin system RelE/ParE family toxin [Elusimicrobia bacterium]|nr:type II toxin-antitoxin system RelE/ParE family toxin [Candidatus Liberimonas magnetica]